MQALKPMIVRVPPALLKQAKHAAVERDTSLRAVVTDALRKELARTKEKSE
jgi:predicted HicB family RNase H-like nuclease